MIKELVQSRHPDYLRWHDTWERMRLSYYGGVEFRTAYLWKYEREDQEDWEARFKRASYDNLLLDCIRRTEALVYSRGVKRTVSGALWESVQKNADGKGAEWGQFIKQILRLLKVYGHLPVVTDRPEGDALNAAEDNTLTPYASPILPQNLLNWGVNADGSLSWAFYRGMTREAKPGALSEPVMRYWLVEPGKTSRWHEEKRKDKVVYVEDPVVKTGLAVVPIVLIHDMEPDADSVVGRAGLSDVNDLSIKMFNQTSWYDQLLYKTNYSTLAAVPFNGSGEEPEVVVGAGDVFWVPENGQMPQWISPDTTPADVFDRKLREIRRRVYEMAELDAGLEEDTARQLSGEAYDRRHRAMEDMAKRTGQTMQAAEEAILELLLNQWGGQKAEIEIQYPKRYGVRSTQGALQALQAVEQVAGLPPDVKGYIASQIVFTEDFVDLSDEDQQKMAEAVRTFDPGKAEAERTKAVELAKTEAQLPAKQLESQTRLEEAKINATQKKPGLFGG